MINRGCYRETKSNGDGHKDKIEREVLIGSESSGNFYYDEGVEEGSLTLKFRNEKGRLVAKFATTFHMQSVTDELTTVDEDFTISLVGSPNAYFVTMSTIGVPVDADAKDKAVPYGIFSTSETCIGASTSKRNIYALVDGTWEETKEFTITDASYFIAE